MKIQQLKVVISWTNNLLFQHVTLCTCTCRRWHSWLEIRWTILRGPYWTQATCQDQQPNITHLTFLLSLNKHLFKFTVDWFGYGLKLTAWKLAWKMILRKTHHWSLLIADENYFCFIPLLVIAWTFVPINVCYDKVLAFKTWSICYSTYKNSEKQVPHILNFLWIAIR